MVSAGASVRQPSSIRRPVSAASATARVTRRVSTASRPPTSGSARPPHHVAEVRQLHLQRIPPLDGDRAALHRLPPGRRLGVAAHPQRWNGQGAARSRDQVAVVVGRRRVGGVLARGVLPRPRGGGGVGEQERPERAGGEPHRDGDGVLDREAAGLRTRQGLDRDDVPADRAQVVDLVDQVDQDRTAAGFAAPGGDVEVVVRLVEQRAALDGDDRSQEAAPHSLGRGGEHRAVPPMVADEQRDAGPLGRLDQSESLGHGAGDRLLDQDGQSGGHAVEAVREVQVVRRGHDHAGRVVRGQRLGERGVARDPGGVGDVGRRGRRIDDRGEDGLRVAPDQLDVPAADQPGADHHERDRLPVRLHGGAHPGTTAASPRPWPRARPSGPRRRRVSRAEARDPGAALRSHPYGTSAVPYPP